jgi:hypothetical protein
MDAFGSAAAGLGGVAQVASIGSAFWLGTRLVRRSLRAGGGMPERLLGVHLIAAIGLGSLLLSFASVSAYASTPLSPAAFEGLVVAGNVATLVGMGAALWFNALVFHGGERRPMALAATATALMCAAFLYYALAGGTKSPAALFGRSYWPLVAAMTACNLWLIRNALACRKQLLRRLALGLADPMVVERMLLWAVSSLSRLGLVLMAPVLNAWIDLGSLRHAAPWLLTLSALLIFSSCASLWLMLVPSARYRRWVEARYAPLSLSPASPRSSA